MGKRAIEDVHVGDEATVKSDSFSRKKSRRDKTEKRQKHTTPLESTTTTDGTSTPVAGDDTQSALGIVSVGGDDKEKESKAERKAAKKARREAKEAKKALKASSEDSEPHKAASVEEDKAVAKAAKKARKAEKAEKKKSKKTVDTEIDEASSTTTSKATSAMTSALPSQAESPTTSPEPVVENGALYYVEDKELAALPQSEIDSYLTTNAVTIDDPLPSSRKLRPVIKFAYLPVTDESQRAPFAKFSAPTPIQAATWPSLLSGRDMIGVAETGSGKTLAFGVPCIRFISSLPKKQQKGVKAVVVSPTRELAVQIHDQLVQLATPAGLQVVCVYGGVPKDPQIKAARTAHIVVATPGRLNDLIGDGSADLSKAEYVVLDEADRMLDKGFEEAIRQIISQTPKKRQTLMFTATWPPSVRELASTFMQSPVKITIGDNVSGELRANTRIKQLVEVVEPRAKEARLLQLLKQYQSGKNKDDRILVFALYKKEAMRVEGFLRSKGFRVGGIHGDLSQEKRTASLQAFKEGHVPLLVATDVAARYVFLFSSFLPYPEQASTLTNFLHFPPFIYFLDILYYSSNHYFRGLDIPSVKLVINNTFPLTAEDYVHRIGRTGRAGKEGLAITLFTENDKALSGA